MPVEFDLCEMEDGYLVYHPGTGNTHLLDNNAASVLLLLLEHKRLPEGDLQWPISDTSASESPQSLTDTLESLKEIFLIEERE